MTSASPRYIETVATVGYRFKCTVEVVGRVVPSDLPCPDRSIPKDGSIVETLTAKGAGGGPAGFPASLAARRHHYRWDPRFIRLVPAPPSAAAEHHGIQPDHARWPSKSSRGNRREQALFQSDVGAVITCIYCRGRNIGRRDCTGPRSNTQPTPSGRFAGCFRLSHFFRSRSSVACLRCGMFPFWEAPNGASRRSMEIPNAQRFHRTVNPWLTPQQEDIYVVRSDGTEAHKLVSAGNDVMLHPSGLLMAAQSGSP